MQPKTIRGLISIGIAAAAAVVATTLSQSAPAAATGGGECVTVWHTDKAGITANDGATADLVAKDEPNGIPEGGVKVATPQQASRVWWDRQLTDGVDMGKVKTLSYRATKIDNAATNAAAMPAMRIVLDLGGGKIATIVYEPYYQIAGNPTIKAPKTWNLLDGKFWTSSDGVAGLPKEGGGSYAGNKTWSYIAEKNPKAEVIAYGWQQGTYNTGTVGVVNDVKFGTGYSCRTDSWKPGPASPSPSSSKSPSPAPSSASPAASASASTSPVAAPPASSLPVTGAAVPAIVAVGLVLVAAGVLMVRRRRQVKFTTS